MGDEGEYWRDVNEWKKERKKIHGIDCPGCNIKEPKRIPTRMLPGQKCRVCGYVDRRPGIPRDKFKFEKP